mmetsp:Transcript_21235/g.47686  ORF Transcript_21235/g.47686 Transcript_21235/m.47686 type:complete len:221 (-) Transcript_21235:155-817(-)
MFRKAPPLAQLHTYSSFTARSYGPHHCKSTSWPWRPQEAHPMRRAAVGVEEAAATFHGAVSPGGKVLVIPARTPCRLRALPARAALVVSSLQQVRRDGMRAGTGQRWRSAFPLGLELLQPDETARGEAGRRALRRHAPQYVARHILQRNGSMAGGVQSRATAHRGWCSRGRVCGCWQLLQVHVKQALGTQGVSRGGSHTAVLLTVARGRAEYVSWPVRSW